MSIGIIKVVLRISALVQTKKKKKNTPLYKYLIILLNENNNKKRLYHLNARVSSPLFGIIM